MGKFIEDRSRGFLPFTKHCYQRYLDDQELRLIDSLLDDRVLNDLLACPGYTPAMRQVSPAHLFRAELLKALRYADLSYRKYCALPVNRLENKSVRCLFTSAPAQENSGASQSIESIPEYFDHNPPGQSDGLHHPPFGQRDQATVSISKSAGWILLIWPVRAVRYP